MAKPSATFGVDEFGEAELGDRRLVNRLIRIADACLDHPEASLPDKFHDPAEYRACLRLFRHPAATHATVLEPHQLHTLTRMDATPGVVLIIHDTTELDFSGQHTIRSGLGPIGNGGGHGFLCHNSLAIDAATGTLLGLASQVLITREPTPPGLTRQQHRDRERESRLWRLGVDEIGGAPAGRVWLHVADRGADAFEFLHHLHAGHRDYLIRAQHDRALGDGTRLFAHVRTAPVEASWEVDLPAIPGRPARRANLRASKVVVTLPPPHNCRGNYPHEPLKTTVVRVWEVDPPAGQEALEWFLLTSRPTDTVESLRELVGYYRRRTVVEEYHKGQKTGVGIERLELEDVSSLRVAIALLSVVAVAVVNLRTLGRDPATAEQPASNCVPPLWVSVLSVRRRGRVESLTVAEFIRELAILGGWIPRRKQPPGWLVLWRGWERLHTMIDYELSRPSCGKL